MQLHFTRAQAPREAAFALVEMTGFAGAVHASATARLGAEDNGMLIAESAVKRMAEPA